MSINIYGYKEPEQITSEETQNEDTSYIVPVQFETPDFEKLLEDDSQPPPPFKLSLEEEQEKEEDNFFDKSVDFLFEDEDDLSKANEDLNFIERFYEEAKLSGQMAQSQKYISEIDLKGYKGQEISEEERIKRNEEKLKLEAYTQSREDEGFLWGAYRSTLQSFVPQAIQGTYAAIEGGLQAGATAGIATLAFGPVSGLSAASAFTAGAGYGVINYGFEQNAAEIYGSIIDLESANGTKIDEDTARILATLGGTASAALEAFGLNQAIKLFPQLKLLKNEVQKDAVLMALKNPSVLKALGKSGAQIMAGLGSEIATETAQTGVQLVSQEIAKKTEEDFIDANPLTKEQVIANLKDTAFETLKSVVIPFVAIGGVNITRSNVRSLKESVVKAQSLQNLITQSKQSKLVKENPNTAEQEFTKIIETKPEMETTYFQADDILEALFQDEEGLKLAKKLGIKDDDLATALELNLPIQVSTAKALSHLYPSKYGQNLEKKGSFSPNELSLLQIEEALPQNISTQEFDNLLEAEQYIEDTLSPLYQEDIALQELESIATPYIQPLIDAGYTQNQAKQQALTFAANAQRMAPLFNQSPQEFLQQRLHITNKESYQDENGLFQAMQESKASNLEEFTNEARTNKQAKQEYFTISKDFQGLEKHGLGNVQIDITHGFIRHMDKKRSKKTISLSQEIENILSNAEELELIYESSYGNRYATVYKENGKTYALIFNVSQGKKGNRVYPVTTYTGNEKTIRDIIEKEKRVNSRSVSQNEVTPTKQELSSKNNIATNQDNVNSTQLHQQAQKSPRGMIQFDPTSETTKALITIFKDRKNLSTVLHEAGHFWLSILQDAYLLENAPEWVKNSYETLAKELGFDTKKPLTKETHESFARLTEAYFREGKAPRKELQNAFAQFKNWLLSVYKYVGNLLKAEELNDEIRKVFDSLLATEKQIEEAKQNFNSESIMQDNELIKIFDIPDEKRTAYHEAIEKGKRRADAIIALRKRAALEQVEADAKNVAIQTIPEMSLYYSLNNIRKNGKISFESLLGFIEEKTAFELLTKWNTNTPYTNLISQDKGLSIDDAAAYFNLDGESLIDILLNEMTENQFINDYVDNQKQQFEAIFDADVEYISSETEQALQIEIEALGARPLSKNQINAYVQQKTGQKKSSEVDADYKNLKADLQKQKKILLHALANFKKEINAENKEKLKEQIVNIKKQEQLKRALLKEFYNKKMRKEFITRNVRKIAKSKSIPENYKQQIIQLMASFKGLGTKNTMAKENTPTLSNFIASMYPEVEGLPFIQPPEVPEWLMSSSSRKNAQNLNELTSQELEELFSLIKALAHTGRSEKKLLGALHKLEIENTVNKLIEPLSKLTEKSFLSDSQKASILGGLHTLGRQALSSMSIMRYTFAKADGFKLEKGIHNELIIKPIQTAQIEEQRLIQHFNKRMAEIWGSLASTNNLKEFTIEGIILPEKVKQRWGNTFNMDRIIAIALNMGNEGNLKALMNGYSWTMEDLQIITSHLSNEHLQAIQKTWDMLEELKPHLQKTYKAINGTDMSEVKASAFTFTSSNGENITLKGGYYPLQFDKDLAPNHAMTNDIDAVINANAFIPNAPNTKKGMTIERKGTNLPPLLSFSQVINRHLTDSIKYATHTIPVRNAYELVRNERYKEAFIRALTEEEYNQIIPWLKSIANVDRAPLEFAEKTAKTLVKRGSTYAMGLSLRTMLMQFTGIPISIQEIGIKAYLKGSLKMITSKSLSYNEVKKLSPYMASRSDTFDKTISETLSSFDPNKHALKIGNKIITRTEFEKAAFGFISMADAMVAFPTWIGKYDAEIAKGTNPQEAIYLADSAVIRAQGSGLGMDVNALMRKKGALEFLLMFMSFAMNWQNRQRFYLAGRLENRRKGNSQINTKEYYRHIALEWLMPVMFTLMLQAAQEEELPETKDVIEEFASYSLMGWPIIRDIASSFTWNKDFGSTAAGSGFNMAVRAGKGIYKQATSETSEEYQYNTMKNVINSVGFFTGIPTNSFFRAGEGTASWLEGEAGIAAIFLGKPYK